MASLTTNLKLISLPSSILRPFKCLQFPSTRWLPTPNVS